MSTTKTIFLRKIENLLWVGFKNPFSISFSNNTALDGSCSNFKTIGAIQMQIIQFDLLYLPAYLIIQDAPV